LINQVLKSVDLKTSLAACLSPLTHLKVPGFGTIRSFYPLYIKTGIFVKTYSNLATQSVFIKSSDKA